MNIFISIFVLLALFVLYKYTYFFNKKRHKVFQYILIIFLLSLALIDLAIGNSILKNTGFSMQVGLNIGLGLLLIISGFKVIK